MTSSLEELLAKEGFRGRTSRAGARSSSRQEATSLIHLRLKDEIRTASFPSSSRKTERVRSDASEYALRGELQRTGRSVSSINPRVCLVKREKGEQDFSENEIIEVGIEESDTAENDLEMKEKHSKKEQYRRRPKESIKAGHRKSNSFNKYLLQNDGKRSSMKQTDLTDDRSYRGSGNKKNAEVTPTIPAPALDEVAVQAMVSILTGYVKCFLKDEEFRASLHRLCFSTLGEENYESKVIANLEQAIETVERAAEGPTNARELKKALLQLSVISGLNSNDLKAGYTSGVSNSKLSSCAHLYLGVIYKLQKKDRISAKHILQVFCDSPFLARTILLSELWDSLFSPQLSHLKVWHNQEAESLSDEPSRTRKLKLLEKVYNEILDSGTFQFAGYYKDWLTEGVEAPSVPCIRTPSLSIPMHAKEGPHTHSSEQASPASRSFSPQPMVSKKLYESVFGRLSKPGADGTEEDEEIENYEMYTRSSDGSLVEVKHALTYTSNVFECTSPDSLEGSAECAKESICQMEDEVSLTAEGEWLSPAANLTIDIEDVNQNNMGEVLRESPFRKANEITIKAPTKPDLEASDPRLRSTNEMHSSQMKKKPDIKELPTTFEYFDEVSFLASIPQDFICPLIGQLFEDPVTIETGQTFEREAIKEWLDKGNTACPVTRKTLECLTVPVTNFILKRLVGGWKSENLRPLLPFACQVVQNSGRDDSTNQNEMAVYILEQLFGTLNWQDRISNTKQLISHGGLEFFIHRFNFGKLDEKTRVAALLSCCIEADASCRNQIVKSINIQSLLELIRCKQVKSRANTMSLLTELICFSRQRDVALLLNGFPNEEILNVMHVLLLDHQSCPPEKMLLPSVLLLHLDCVVEPKTFSIYREAALNAITVGLEKSLIDEKVRENCCRALLILGGRFSDSGELMTESWILKQAGCDSIWDMNSPERKDKDLPVDDSAKLDDEEEHACEEWLSNVSASLLGSRKGAFLETISKVLQSGDSELVRICLITMAWLSRSLPLMHEVLQVSDISTLISVLKQIVVNSEQPLYKILASMSLLNFSKIPECKVQLMTNVDDMKAPLLSLSGVTSIATQLFAIISAEDL